MRKFLCPKVVRNVIRYGFEADQKRQDRSARSLKEKVAAAEAVRTADGVELGGATNAMHTNAACAPWPACPKLGAVEKLK